MLSIPSDAVFTYSITSEPDEIFECHTKLSHNLTLNHTRGTDVLHAEHNQDSWAVTVVGLCVDAHGEIEREQIPDFILNSAQIPGSTPSSVYSLCDRYAGKYLIYLRTPAGEYLWGDASCSLAIYYDTKNQTIAVTEQLVADLHGYKISSHSQLIAAGTEPGQPFPNDCTMYDEIKCLLPNHFLNLHTREAIRVTIHNYASEFSESEVLERSTALIHTIFKEYSCYEQLVCPLTAGYDSRVNFAFLKNQYKDLTCYTFQHPNFTDATPDLRIPRLLCSKYGITHETIPDATPPVEFRVKIQEIMGSRCSDYAVTLAYTYKQSYPTFTLVNGSILDQIGKSVTGNAIPALLITPQFMRTRIYNRSSAALTELKKYRARLSAREKPIIADLFALENDCCRWAGLSDTIYGLAGVRMLTVFNCRELISLWISLPKRHRINRTIHVHLLKSLDAHLLEFPFTPESRAKKIVKNCWPLFYVASFIYARKKG